MATVVNYCDKHVSLSLSLSLSLCVCVSMCLLVCLSASISSPETHARSLPIFRCMLLKAVARSSSGRVTKFQEKGQFWGCPGHSKALAVFAAAVAAAFAANGIIQSPETSCSRRYHSVCQASANSNPENSEHRRCGLSAGKVMMAVHTAQCWRSLISTIALF